MFQDIRSCLPTVLVLLLTLLVSVTLIPHVFSSVVKSVLSVLSLTITLLHVRQIRDSAALSDLRELHNLTDDQRIPWNLLRKIVNTTKSKS